MRNPHQDDDKMAVLAVLAAAAREAEELMADDGEISPDTAAEVDRRLKLFMQVARQSAR